MPRIALGLVGCGAFGTFLADAIAELPTAELAAVADTPHGRRRPPRRPPPVGDDRRRPRRAPRRPRHRHRRRRHAPVDPRRPRRPGAPSRPARARRETARHRRRRLPPRRRRRGRRRPSRRPSITCCASRHSSPRWPNCSRPRSTVAGCSARSGASRSRTTPPTKTFRPITGSGIRPARAASSSSTASTSSTWPPTSSGLQPDAIQAMSTTRPDGRTDTVCATARYPAAPRPAGTTRSPTPDRAERQSLRLDLGNGDCRLEGWIPLDMQLEAWTDPAGADALLAATSTDEFSVTERQVSVTAAPARRQPQQPHLAGDPPRAHPTRPRRPRQADRLRNLHPAPRHRLPRRHRPRQTAPRHPRRRHRGRRSSQPPRQRRPEHGSTLQVDPIRALIRSERRGSDDPHVITSPPPSPLAPSPD